MVTVGRLLGSGLLAWMGWIHLERWSDGYRHLPTIGNLFLLNFAAAVLIAVALVIGPARFVPMVAGCGAVLAVATVGALMVSRHGGLFGYTEAARAPYVVLSMWVEGAAAVVLLVTAVASTSGRSSRQASPAGGTNPG